MAIFRVTVDSILIREAGEDGGDDDAEWTVFFNSPRSPEELFSPGDSTSDGSVHDGDVIQIDRSYLVDTGTTNRLSLRAGGFENDGSGNDIAAVFLPSVQVDIEPLADGGRFPFLGGDFAYDATMEVAGRFNVLPGVLAEVGNDFAYQANWRVASTMQAQGPVGITVDSLRIVQAGEDPDAQANRAEWNVTFVAGTVGSTESFAFPEQSVIDNQFVPVGRAFTVNPGGNTVLVLRTTGFENDNNPDDPLPQGEVAIRPSTNSYGLTTAVDGGEFAYEVNWTVSLLSTGVIII